MRGVLVALDLETTGLDIQNDSIIEVGAVKIRDGVIIDEYSQLINPGFEIGSETSHITGIYQDDLRRAPMLPQVLPAISDFVGDAPIIAHNVDFDLGFMRRFGVFKETLGIDTVELASILMPRMPRYGLGSLAQALGIELENAHRALDDARATGILYWKLWEKALALPHALVYEIMENARVYSDWVPGVFFKAAHQEQRHLDEGQDLTPRQYFTPYWSNDEAIEPSDNPKMIDPAEIDASLSEGGKLAQFIEGYEERREQVTMSHLVADAFNTGTHTIIEAGTGTGKSLAYLLPSALWAFQNGERVVVATNTLNLQSQLLDNDIPMIQAMVGNDLRAVVMKGRGNYLCPRRLATIRRRKPNSIEEVRTLAKLLIWLEDSDTGDRSEITLRGSEYGVWARLSAQDEGCATHRCMDIMQGRCPFYKAKRSAENAHLVIANHALLISDVMTDNHVLPHYDYLVIDEGHQLEDALTDGMTTRVDQATLLKRLSELGSPNSGLMGDLLRSTRGVVIDKKVMKLEAFMQAVADTLKEMSIVVRRYYDRVYQFLEDTNNLQAYQVRVHNDLRGRAEFAPIKDAWTRLDDYFLSVAESLTHLAEYLQRLDEDGIPDYDDHLNAIRAVARYLFEVRGVLHQFSVEPLANWVYWVSGNDKAYLVIQSAPISVGQMVSEHIWEAKKSVVLTSATLRTDESYDYLNERLFAESVSAHTLGSPFDYKKSTLLYIPTDIPAPNERGYQKMVERGIIELAAALDGRVMVLFTSYNQLKETAVNIAPRLALGGIVVYDQATGGSREALLDGFKETKKAVLLGTRSFWQGVDIQGDNLSALVIVKIPFAVPSDPIFASRSERYEDAFNQYAVPDAILRFRQGFGRLIRTKSDRGIVTIFDSRIIGKRYGEQFLRSLPNCERQDGSLSGLAGVAQAWLGEE